MSEPGETTSSFYCSVCGKLLEPERVAPKPFTLAVAHWECVPEARRAESTAPSAPRQIGVLEAMKTAWRKLKARDA